MKKFFAAIMILAIAAGCATVNPKQDKPATPQPDKIVTYKTIGDVELDMHIFNPPGHKPGDKTPAIVLFYGGGFVGGDVQQFYRQSKYLASRGMVAICPWYRVKSRHGTTPKESVKDGKSAIRWVRTHADTLGIDTKMLAAGGGSAGGCIAAATGTLKGLNEDGEDTSISSRPNAMVLFNPVFDNVPGRNYSHGRAKEYGKEFLPMHNLSKDTPPTVVFLGSEDHLTPVATAENYKQLMEKFGARCDLHIYEGQKHGFFNNAKYYETLLEADKFLTSLGYMTGKPTLQRKETQSSIEK